MSKSLLIVPESLKAVDVFDEDKTESIIKAIEDEVNSIILDATTTKGRANITSLAYKVSRSKTALDELGKELCSEWKTKSGLVDSDRRTIKTRLDALRDKVKKPLLDWQVKEDEKIEAEETKKREAEEKEVSRIELIKERLEAVNELVNGLLNASSTEISEQLKIAENILTSSFEEFENVAIESRDSAIKALQKALDEKVLFETQQAEQEKLNKKMEEQQAKLDEQQAKLDAEENERMIKVREENAAKEAADKATKHAELVAQAKINEANERERLAAEQVELARKEAAETEARLKREAKEAADKELAEAKAREADKEHKKSINNAAVKCLVDAGVSKTAAIACITAIAQRKVENVTISY